MRIRQSLSALLILVIALMIISCSGPTPEPPGSEDDNPSTTEVTAAKGTETPTPIASTPEEDEPATAEVAPTATIDLSTLVTTLADVKSAVIRIEAQGTIVDPEFGVYSGPGYGS